MTALPPLATVWSDGRRKFRLDGRDDDGRAILTRLDPRPGERKATRVKAERLRRMTQVPFDADECLAILALARGLLANGWCKDSYARDATGAPTPDSSAEAAQFSADGAICRATFEVRGHSPGVGCEMAFLMTRRFRPDPTEFLHTWNDRQTSAVPVVALFDRAVKDLDAVIARRNDE